MTRRIHARITWSVLFAAVLFGLWAGESRAARQFDGLCAIVKIEIAQRMALERVGFLATLRITNNEIDASITDFSAGLTFLQKPNDPEWVESEASDLFFVQPPRLDGIAGIDGDGVIGPGETAVISWFIIPKVAAGGTTPIGLDYEIGAEIAGNLYGVEIPRETMLVLPAIITVLPDPQLEITYFQPRDVIGDDPFTPTVEAPIPFTLGVLVKNSGYGPARKVRIQSEQPRIVENEQNLVLVAQLLGARIDDQSTDYTSLNLDLGNIEPGRCRKGAWDMITSLSGEFQEFKASYTHASELGGRDTSIIKSLNAYFIQHEVRNDQPGRDRLLDFLADTIDDDQQMPDTLFESDCNVVPVNRLLDVEVLDYRSDTFTAVVRAHADFENWVYVQLDDPAQARYAITAVVRSDGKVLDPANYWTNIRYHPQTNTKLTYLNLFDFVALGDYTYTVTYAPPAADNQAPVTTLRFAGEFHEAAGTYYILPETQIYFTVEDANPVATYRDLDGAGEVPGLPFTIDTPGGHTLTYYSRDDRGNQEAERTATVVVSDTYPAIANLATDTDELFIAGDSVSVRPTRAALTFDGSTTAGGLQSRIEVFRGVYAFVTLLGVPASPSRAADVILTVGGEHVDYYRYRLDGGAWSAEAAVNVPLALNGLSSGERTLEVKGRSALGGYLPDDQAVSVSWTVDAGAPDIAVDGPAIPTRALDATFDISTVSGYFCYRLDGAYYRPDNGPGAPVVFTRLAPGEHLLEVLPRADAGATCPGDEPGTAYRWEVDPGFGYAFPAAERIYSGDGGAAIGSATVTWDGLTDGGVVAAPGWYTVKVTVDDPLGRSASAVQLVRVGEMVTDGAALAPVVSAGQREAHAFGRWVVWQDQRNGNWDIYAQEIGNPAATPLQLTANAFNQERPRTDGTYVVWEDRQADGTWDVWIKDLTRSDPASAVTSTPGTNERKPVVYWPWVVYQAQPAASPTAPWQLQAYHLVDHTTEPVDASGFDQVDAALHRQRIVWQDFRDAGPGEIYFKDLVDGTIRRLTTQSAAQLWPVIYDHWIVWSDNRDGQVDLYAFNLKRGAEVRLTATPYDETRPYLNGPWVVYTDDSPGDGDTNVRILHLANRAAVQLTNAASPKEKASLAAGHLLWTDRRTGVAQVMAGSLPNLQPVFDNRNTIAVTAVMAARQPDAYTLLAAMHAQAGVTAITRYTALLPQPVSETASWDGSQASGDNFALVPGTFLWVDFDATRILDLGVNPCGTVDLQAGVNVFSTTCIPDRTTAWSLIRELGASNVSALRVLDADSGQWRVAAVVDGRLVGEDFTIPTVAVLMLDLQTALGPWTPGETP